eukprot:4017174-Prymnesium_polylepis.1
MLVFIHARFDFTDDSTDDSTDEFNDATDATDDSTDDSTYDFTNHTSSIRCLLAWMLGEQYVGHSDCPNEGLATRSRLAQGLGRPDVSRSHRRRSLQRRRVHLRGVREVRKGPEGVEVASHA